MYILVSTRLSHNGLRRTAHLIARPDVGVRARDRLDPAALWPNPVAGRPGLVHDCWPRKPLSAANEGGSGGGCRVFLCF